MTVGLYGINAATFQSYGGRNLEGEEVGEKQELVSFLHFKGNRFVTVADGDALSRTAVLRSLADFLVVLELRIVPYIAHFVVVYPHISVLAVFQIIECMRDGGGNEP